MGNYNSNYCAKDKNRQASAAESGLGKGFYRLNYFPLRETLKKESLHPCEYS